MFVVFMVHFLSFSISEKQITQTQSVENDNVKIISCIFEKCKSQSNGGAVYVLSKQFEVSIEKSTFRFCFSGKKRGGVYVICETFKSNYQNCFFRTGCGKDNGNDASALYASVSQEMTSSLVSARMCPIFW